MEAKPPIVDSPWFWVLMFSGMALVALVAMGPKYGGRQSRLELQYQARERIAAQRIDERQSRNNAGQASRGTQQGATQNSSDKSLRMAERREFASPEETLVPLWPLGVLLGSLMIVSLVMLHRGRGRPGSLDVETPPE